MKKLIFLIFILSLSLMANAQLLRFGVRGGVNASKVNIDQKLIVTSGSEEYILKGLSESKFGYHFGAFMRIKLSVLSVQPELIFSSTGGKVSVTDINGFEDIKELNFNRVNVPVLVGINMGPIRFHGGPVGTFLISSKADLFNYKDNLQKATFGYQAGIGFDLLKKITFDARYEGSLSKLGSGVSVGGQNFNFDSRDSQFIFSLGFFF